MQIIRGTPVFVNRGAVILEDEEVDVIVHALVEERDRVTRAHGGQYGKMPLWKLNDFIADLEKYKEGRGG